MTNQTLMAVQSFKFRTYQLPPHTIDVSSPSRWRNPFRVGHKYRDMVILSLIADTYAEFKQWAQAGGYIPATRADSLHMYKRYVSRYPQLDVNKLRGYNLACICPLGTPHCHRDWLLQAANASQTAENT